MIPYLHVVDESAGLRYQTSGVLEEPADVDGGTRLESELPLTGRVGSTPTSSA